MLIVCDKIGRSRKGNQQIINLFQILATFNKKGTQDHKISYANEQQKIQQTVPENPKISKDWNSVRSQNEFASCIDLISLYCSEMHHKTSDEN